MKHLQIYIFVHDEIAMQKDTPHSELLLRTVLNHITSPSGHSQRFQKNESTNTVSPVTKINQTLSKYLHGFLLQNIYIFHTWTR